MLKRRIASVAVGAGAIIAIAIPSAFGATLTYKITAGTAAKGSVTYSGKTAKGTASNPAIKFTDTTKNLPLGCNSGTASGSVKLGKAVAAAKAGTITKTTWSGCVGPNQLALTPKQSGTWYLNGAAKTATGKTKVFVSNVVANVSDSTGLCKFTVYGSADGVYNNATKSLAMAPRAGSGHQLKVKNASCLGLIANGDHVSFQGTYHITTPKGALKIVNS